jgi:rifampicin phosphotransferase
MTTSVPIIPRASLPIEPIPVPIEIPPGYWEHDASHFPNASYPIDSFIPDLIASGVRSWVDEFGYLFDGLEFRDIAGWTYQRIRPFGGKDSPVLPDWAMRLLIRVIPKMRERVSVAREAVRTDKPGRYIERWRHDWRPELEQAIHVIQVVDRAALSDVALQRHIDDVLELTAQGIRIHLLIHASLAMILFEFVGTCERVLDWDLAETMKLLSGTSSMSTEPARRLNDLARMATKHPNLLDIGSTPEPEVLSRLERLDTAFAAALESYLAAYGHRALGDSCAEPTIAQRPSFVLGLLRGQLEAGYQPAVVDEANREARNRALAVARSRLQHDPSGLRMFDVAMERALQAYPAREDNEFYTLSAPFAQARYAVQELGTRLTAQGVIRECDDVFFLHLGEARAALSDRRDRGALVARRKGERAWAVANPGPPAYGQRAPSPSLSFMPRDASLPMESMLWSLQSMQALDAHHAGRPAASVLRGTPAAAGSYTGPARVIRGEWEFDKLRVEDVLVCPMTSPVWSVLFPLVGALVTDSGGVLSHPAIIAREYRVPAVVATGNATESLEDGGLVTVDGETGLVSVASRGRSPG